MLFNTPVFVFIFLPILILASLIAGGRYRNGLLLAASLLFYAWGEPFFVLVLLLSLVFNFLIAQRIDPGGQPAARWLWLGVVCNAGLLVLFKIGGVYFPQSVNQAITTVLGIQTLPAYGSMHLPIGISFYTFEAIAYLVDVFKKRCPSEKKFWDFALYVLLFPKVITGPISRYRNVVEQIKTPQLSGRRLYTGARRFGLGFCKKALLADMLGLTVDRVFALGAGDLTISLAWLGIVGYTLQIYYDFSGYTDMAIGLAGMLGFDLPENFDYPYITTSITEFWRRWHLSLSSWFRDYVFFPLERRFRRKSPLLQYANILIVFLLTGLWHGITANFLIWGLWHGVWMMLERSPWGDTLRKAWRPWQHVYALLAIMVGWVFFRAADLSQALDYLKAMSGFARFVAPLPYSVMPPLDRYTWLAFGLGIVFAMPLGSIVQMALKPWGRSVAPGSRLHVLGDGTLLALFGAALAVMAHATHQAYIYFRF